MSDSVRLHRWQPTRLPCPWDSPGQNTGVGCISFSNAWKWKVKGKLLSRVCLFANVLMLNKRRREKKKVHYIPFPYVTWIFSAFIVDILQLSLLVSIIVCWVAVEYFETSLWIQMLLFCQSETLKSFCFIIIKGLIYQNFTISTFSTALCIMEKKVGLFNFMN